MTESELYEKIYHQPDDDTWWVEDKSGSLQGPYTSKRRAELEAEAIHGKIDEVDNE